MAESRLPMYAANALYNGGGGGGSGGFGSNGIGGGIAQLFSGLFGDSGAPYEKAGEAYKPYVDKAEGAFNPFYKSGTAAIPQFQNWLNSMKDPSSFINNLMTKYQQSPWAKFRTDQGIRANNNSASASGLIGSTPLGQANADYAENISSEDMGQWLQHVLGINTNYGAGLNDMYHTGFGAAEGLGNLYSGAGENMAKLAYGKEQGAQQDQSNIFSGLSHILFG